MTRRDDIFAMPGNVQWRREWVGDNAGRYEWHTADGRLVAWCERRWFETDAVTGVKRAMHVYRASLDGVVSERKWRTLQEAMAAAATARWQKDSQSRVA